ncbi:MAG: ERCC4 domain-containing protein, partial [Desulfohalobiaceae bacterium]
SRRVSLPVGDYAVEHAGEIAAVVERKTFADFLTSLVKINTLHMTLSELKRSPRSALVVEAPFHYFTDPKRLAPSRMAAGSVVTLIMELYARHPGVQIVFLENRKVAAHWCGAFLEQCLVCWRFDAREQPVFKEPREAYQTATYRSPEAFVQVVKRFSFTQLQANFPDWSAGRLRYRLDKMRKQGKLVCTGRGLKAVWEVRDSG